MQIIKSISQGKNKKLSKVLLSLQVYAIINALFCMKPDNLGAK